MNVWNETAHTITELLIHSLWVGTLLLLLLQAALVLLPKRLAAIRYWIALITLIAIPVLTVFTSSHPDTILPAPSPEVSAITSSEGIGSSPAYEAASPIYLFFGFAWILGALLSSTRSLYSLFSLNRVGQEAIPVTSPAILAELNALQVQLGILRPIRLLMTHHVQSPVTFGWIRPVILFPVSMMSGIPAAHLGPILAHELAHISRGDFLSSLLIKLTEAVLFYHPAVWWISRILREERERACDDQVIADPYPVRRYAKALLWLEENRVSANHHPFVLAADGTSIILRIERLSADSKERVSHRPALSSLRIFTFSVLMVLALTALGDESDPSTHQTSGAPFEHIGASIHRARLAASAISYSPTWDSKKIDRRMVPLFCSVAIIEREGVLFRLDDDSKPLFSEFPNAWVLKHELNLLDSRLPYQDPDQDGFTNAEEYQEETHPNDPGSHPLLIRKLQFRGMKSQNFTIRYSAMPDGKTAQVHLIDHRYGRKEAVFLSAGDRTQGGFFQIDSIRKEALNATFLPTGESLILPKNTSVTASIPFAEFHFRNDSFYVRKGDDFRITAEPDITYQLLSIEEKECLVELPDGGKMTLPAASP